MYCTLEPDEPSGIPMINNIETKQNKEHRFKMRKKEVPCDHLTSFIKLLSHYRRANDLIPSILI